MVREWLNDLESPSTGTIAVFDGEVQWCSEESPGRRVWVEVSDCHCKVRVHKSYEQTTQQFCDKVRKMRDVLNGFIDHLEESEEEVN